jgi:glutathione peroxidase
MVVMVATLALVISAQAKTAGDMNYLTVPFNTISGQTTDLAAFTGNVVLLVNVASKCGFTPQYAGLEKLYETYKGRGFTIVGFPSNDFHGQEPGTNQEILTFCQTNYGVTFPLMSKIDVVGPNQHPLYAYLTKESPQPGEITWNFNKFLLDKNGKVVARFDSKVTPEDPALVSQIETLLNQKP